jgi:hypothetical protein
MALTVAQRVLPFPSHAWDLIYHNVNSKISKHSGNRDDILSILLSIIIDICLITGAIDLSRNVV